MKRFKYDVVKLIEAVRDRPCLWNKHLDNYKDRIERKEAWNQIFYILDKRYDVMSSDDQRLTSEIVTSKWTNIRDTFVKTIRRKGRQKKHYMLYDHLKFLLKVIPEPEHSPEDQDNLGYTDDLNDCTQDSGAHEETTQFDNEPKFIDHELGYDDSEQSEAEVTPYKPSSSKRKRVKKEALEEKRNDSRMDDSSNIDFVSVDDHRIMNEDEAFFASLLPTVVKYSEEERLEFRIEVLAVMKKISDQRKSVY